MKLFTFFGVSMPPAHSLCIYWWPWEAQKHEANKLCTCVNVGEGGDPSFEQKDSLAEVRNKKAVHDETCGNTGMDGSDRMFVISQGLADAGQRSKLSSIPLCGRMLRPRS